ncbi:hypothetical protein GCM10010977_32390 [Citricoccus zhacaiensis]|uniref:DUF2384 domain-containing protein n=1 Tax=Citricoccus zhacaiensis TaxID=489142 RepID=A0ABQ2MD51_9MICC|nr:hypothetical protein [Citricoccus zhacaiensis]GGO49755.1 hypothetical protein GCM10010977_32390 [Citricoccus zhacaiensis]
MTTAPLTPRVGLEASANASRLEIPEIVSGLREILGARLVAYLGGVKETRTVREWVEGKRSPSSDLVRRRLRDAYQVAAMLNEVDAPGVVQAWFTGMNPQLGDRAPARLLRDGGPEAATEVLGAARAFIATAG